MERVKEFVDFLEEYTDFIIKLATSRAEFEMRQEDLKNIDRKIFKSNGSDASRAVGKEFGYERDKLALQVKRSENNKLRHESEIQPKINEGLSSLSGLAEILAEAGLDRQQVEQLLAGVMFRINNKISPESEKQPFIVGPQNS